MYKFLAAVLFCTVAHAAAPLPAHGPTPRARQAGTQPEVIIRTAAAGVSHRADAGRDKRAPVAMGSSGNEAPDPSAHHMAFAALALIAGIAIRRYGVSRK